MSRKSEFARRFQRAIEDERNLGYWPELCRRIDYGQAIPVIGSSVYFEGIFDIDGDGIIGISTNQANPRGLSVEEQLTEAWAEDVGYPMVEVHSLPKVAQYDRTVKSVDEFSAKTNYLNWLKDALLYLAESDVDVPANIIDELARSLDELSFSDLTTELDYPKVVEGNIDPLQILAKLPLPIYITTSYFDFMERALIREAKNPRTQLCYWNTEPLKIAPEHRSDHNLKPTPDQPLVYHMYGLEQYPESIVLSEKDYLGFLRSISLDQNANAPTIPLYLRKALTQSSLCLLGYTIESWEFKALFRGVIKNMPATLRTFNLAVQLLPGTANVNEAARDFIDRYFEQENFTIFWGEADSFLEALWQEWQNWLS